MESISIQERKRINQRATLLLIEKLEALRSTPFRLLRGGHYQEESGVFITQFQISENQPFFGSKQIKVAVMHAKSQQILVESIFYRVSE